MYKLSKNLAFILLLFSAFGVNAQMYLFINTFEVLL